QCQLIENMLSYHIRNVPVLSTIEMSPGCGFILPRKRRVSFFVEGLFSGDVSGRGEGCGGVGGRGAGGRGQRPLPRSALSKPPSVRGTADADRDSESRLLRLRSPAPERDSWPAPNADFAVRSE